MTDTVTSQLCYATMVHALQYLHCSNELCLHIPNFIKIRKLSVDGWMD